MNWNTLAGVALGVALTYTIEKLIRQDDKALNARLALTATSSLIWAGTPYLGLQKHLYQAGVELDDAKIGADLIKQWQDAAMACWIDSRETSETDPNGEGWITKSLLDAYGEVEAGLHSELRKQWWQVWK